MNNREFGSHCFCKIKKPNKYLLKLSFNKKIHTKLSFPPQQKTDTTAQLYCTLSMYVTNTKNYFPPEPKKLTQHHNCMVL